MPTPAPATKTPPGPAWPNAGLSTRADIAGPAASCTGLTPTPTVLTRAPSSSASSTSIPPLCQSADEIRSGSGRVPGPQHDVRHALDVTQGPTPGFVIMPDGRCADGSGRRCRGWSGCAGAEAGQERTTGPGAGGDDPRW